MQRNTKHQATPAEMARAMTRAYYRTYAARCPRKWPVTAAAAPAEAPTKPWRRPELEAAAQRLKVARLVCGLSLIKLGERVGVSGAQICKWENARFPIATKHVADVAVALSVTERWLLEGVL